MNKVMPCLMALTLVLSGCYSIRGVVRDKTTGSPVPSAVVNVEDTSGISDAHGRYEVPVSASPGDTIFVNAPGYYIHTQTIQNSDDDIIDIELTPRSTSQDSIER